MKHTKQTNCKLFSLIDKAIFDFDLLEKQDKILVATSGGVDSIVLLDYLQNRMKRKEQMQIFPVFVQSTLSPIFPKTLEELIFSWGLKLEKVQIDLSFDPKKHKRLGCYWCSTRRRAALLEFARGTGCTKIALGHHADDILETFIMNMTTKGRLEGMSAKLKYNRYPATIIRPLCYATKNLIQDYAKTRGYLENCITCHCQSQDSSRLCARQKLAALTSGKESQKYCILKSIIERHH